MQLALLANILENVNSIHASGLAFGIAGRAKTVLPTEDFPLTERYDLHAWRTTWTWLGEREGMPRPVLFSCHYQLALPKGRSASSHGPG